MQTIMTSAGQVLDQPRIFAPSSPAFLWELLSQRIIPSKCYPNGRLVGIEGLVVRGLIKGNQWFADVTGRVIGDDFKPGDITLRCEVLSAKSVSQVYTVWPEKLRPGNIWLIGDLVVVGPPGSEHEVLSADLTLLH
jgi:hypothetical protein